MDPPGTSSYIRCVLVQLTYVACVRRKELATKVKVLKCNAYQEMLAVQNMAQTAGD